MAFFETLPTCKIEVEVVKSKLEPKTETTTTPTSDKPTNPQIKHEIRVIFSHKGYAILYANFLRKSVESSDLVNNLEVDYDVEAKTVFIHILDSTLSLILKDHSGSVLEFATNSEAESWGKFTKLWKQDDLGPEKRRIPKMLNAKQFCTSLVLLENDVRAAMPSNYDAKAKTVSGGYLKRGKEKRERLRHYLDRILDRFLRG